MTSIRKTAAGFPAAMQMVCSACFSALVMGMFLLFVCQVLAPLAPIITLLVVYAVTAVAFEERITRVLSISGIVLYLASWPVVSTWGRVPGLGVWAMGMLLWFFAASLTFDRKLRPAFFRRA